MALTLTLDHPDFPDDREFEISGLGLVKNRESAEIDEEQERAFAAFHGRTLEDALKGNDQISLNGTATLTDISEVIPSDISDRASADPTAMNIDPSTGEVFAEANLNGKASDPDFTPVEVEPPPDVPKGEAKKEEVDVTPGTFVAQEGGEKT